VTLTARILVCAIVAVLATACFGAAATLGLSTDRVGAGSATSALDCATGTTVAYEYSGANVTGAVVANLPAGCQSGKMWFALRDTNDVKVAEAASITFSGGIATITVTPVAASLVKKYSIAVVQ